MHSNRMHTARLLPVSPSMHCGRGVSAPGGSAPGGVSARGVYPSMQWGRHPPMDRQTPVKT